MAEGSLRDQKPSGPETLSANPLELTTNSAEGSKLPDKERQMELHCMIFPSKTAIDAPAKITAAVAQGGQLCGGL